MAARGTVGVALVVTISGAGVFLQLPGAGAFAKVAALPRGALQQLPRTVCDAETDVRSCTRVPVLKRPVSAAVSPDGRSLYVAVDPDSAVVLLARKSKTGALVQRLGAKGCMSEVLEGCAQTVALESPAAVAVDPSGRFVYVAARGSDAIGIFARDTRTGVLRAAGTEERRCLREDTRISDECAHARLIGGVRSLTLSADGRHLYAAGTYGLASFARDARSGALRQLSGPAGCVSADGTDLYTKEVEGDVVDDEAPVVCRAVDTVISSADVAVTPDGRDVYVVDGPGSAVVGFRRDASTGALEPGDVARTCVSADEAFQARGCSPADTLRGSGGLAVSRDGRNIYVAGNEAGSESGTVTVLRRDPGTGSIEQLPGAAGCLGSPGAEGCRPVPGLSGAHDVVVAPDGATVYVFGDSSVAILARARSTGALTPLRRPYSCVGSDSAVPGACTAAAGLSFVNGGVVSPDGRHLYVLAGSSDNPFDARPNANAVTVFARTR